MIGSSSVSSSLLATGSSRAFRSLSKSATISSKSSRFKSSPISISSVSSAKVEASSSKIFSVSDVFVSFSSISSASEESSSAGNGSGAVLVGSILFKISGVKIELYSLLSASEIFFLRG